MSRYLEALALALMAPAISIAQSQQATAALVQGTDVVAVPGVGRVILAFLVTAALAVGVMVVLRRVLPKVSRVGLAEGNLRVLDRATLSAGLRVHVLQVDGKKILLAESRNGLAMTALDKRQEQAPTS